MTTIGESLAKVLPATDLQSGLQEGGISALKAITDQDGLEQFFIDHPSFFLLVDNNLELIRNGLKSDQPDHFLVVHRTLQKNHPVVAGTLVDASVRPLKDRGGHSIELAPILDGRIGQSYIQLNRQRVGDWRPSEMVRRFVSRQQDGLNAILSQHPDLLGSLMNFVDVLPQIQEDPAAITSHLRDYFPGDDSRLPLWMRAGLSLIKGLKSQTGMRLATKAIVTGVQLMAGRFIAGDTVATAQPRFHQLGRQGIGGIADVMGEAVKTEHEADAYLNTYLQIVQDLAADKKVIKMSRKNWAALGKKKASPLFDEAHRYDFQIAVKLSSFYSQWNVADPEGSAKEVKKRLRQLFNQIQKTETAQGVKIGLTVDLEHSQYRDLTYQIFKELLDETQYQSMERVGIVVQANLKDSPQVIHDLAQWSHARQKAGHGKSIQIRLVKGAYVDQEKLQHEQTGYPLKVLGSQRETDMNFQDCVDLILSYAQTLRLSVGSHNDQSYLEAIEKAKYLKIPIEVQMLYGIQEKRQAQLAKWGVPVSAYIPIGEILPGMAYLARRLLENTSQGGFLARVNPKNGSSLADILANPRANPRPYLNRDITAAIPAADLSKPYRREPLTDFSNPKHRERVRVALKMVAEFFERLGIVDPAAGVGFKNAFNRFVSNVSLNALENRNMAINSWRTTLDSLNRFFLGEQENILHDLVAAGLNRDNFPWLHPTKPTVGNDFSWPPELVSRNPAVSDQAHDSILGDVHTPMGEFEIDWTVKNARTGFALWAATSVDHRVQVLRQVAQKMREQIAALTALIIKEAGKPLLEADAEVAEAIDFIEYYTRQALSMAHDPDRIFKPKGVAVVIAPWNFPLAILAGMTTAALVTGNSVVMKPSEETPLIAYKFLQLLRESGVDKDAIHMLAGDTRVGASLLKQQGIDLVAFTGSAKAGQEIYAQMTPRGTHVIAEMGGKNALIVDSDANPDDVIEAVLQGKFGYSGQKCSAIDRLIIIGDENKYSALKQRLIEAVEALVVGDPSDFGTTIGPVIRKNDKERLLALLGRVSPVEIEGKLKGRILLDGRNGALPEGGHFVRPSIIESDDYDNGLWQEEFFGPLLVMTRMDSLADAVSLAQKSRYSLTGGFISRSPSNIEYVREHWQVGNLYINSRSATTGAVVGENSFGGQKLSGSHASKAGGAQYLHQFVNASWRVGRAPENPINFIKERIAALLENPNQFSPLYSPKGSTPDSVSIHNTVDFRPRGHGIIVVDSDDPKNLTLLEAAAQAAGNTFEVVGFSATNQAGILKVNKPDDAGNISQELYSVLRRSELIGKVVDPKAKWVAFASQAEDKTINRLVQIVISQAAAKTYEGQDFMRSVMTFTDPAAQIEDLAAMLFETRTVSQNLARHGFAPPIKKPPATTITLDESPQKPLIMAHVEPPISMQSSVPLAHQLDINRGIVGAGVFGYSAGMLSVQPANIFGLGVLSGVR